MLFFVYFFFFFSISKMPLLPVVILASTNSNSGLPVTWKVFTEAAGNHCFHFHKTSVIKKKKERNGYRFICNVTMVDILQYNHMFVKLFVPCKLMNQTILGFQSAFVSENVFASIKMYHQRSCIWFF